MAHIENPASGTGPRPTGTNTPSHVGGLKMSFRPVPVPPPPTVLGTGVPKNVDAVAEALRSKLGADAVKSVEKAHKGDPYVVVEASRIVEALKILRDDERFLCHLMLCISATDFLPVKAMPPAEEGAALPPDTPGRIEIAYHLDSFVHRHQIVLKVLLDRDQPRLPSASEVYRAANWYERECYDLLGVDFTNHPYLERILLPSDWVGHPLRRDYAFPEEYNGMKVPL